MAFPQDPHDALLEFQLVDGTWVEATDPVREDAGITIERGRDNEVAEVERGQARFTWDNTGGVFSPRNPRSPYYGQFGRNTPVRISVARGSRRLVLPGAAGDRVTCPDATALGITGDIDIRIDLTASAWVSTDLCGKYEATSDQRSWILQTRFDGCLMFSWTTAGTSGSFDTITSSEPIPLYPRRQAIRVTLDVNNGASGKTATFYVADTIAGPWTQLGDAVTEAGTTSIFDGTGALEVGDVVDVTALFLWGEPSSPVRGQLHAFELRNGINGTVVANPDFSVPSEGATSFADTASSPNTWTLQGDAEITNRRWRHHGEMSLAEPSSDLSGNSLYASAVSSGVFQRVSQGGALRSTMYRGMTSLAAVQPIAYWSMEDAAGSTVIASGLPNGSPMTFNGSPQLATSDVFPGSDSLPTLSNCNWDAKIEFSQQTTGTIQVRFLCAVPTGGTTDGAIVARLWTTGSIRRWDLRYDTSSAGSVTLLAYDRDLTLVHTSGATGGLDGSAARFSIELTQDGSNIDYGLGFSKVDNPGGFTSTGTVSSNTFGQVTTVNFCPNLDMDDVAVGHLSVHSVATSLLDLNDELIAYAGETAGRRVERLCAEEGLAFRAIGDLDTTELMGAQTPEGLMALLNECAGADGGLLYEPKDVLGVGYRTRDTMYNQAPRVQLVAEQLDGSPAPVDDDQRTRNDITMSRKGGSSARESVTTGPMSTQPPPVGVGTYDESATVNNAEDLRLPHHARWRAHLGTVDEARWPVIPINLAADEVTADPALIEALLDHEFGDLLALDDLPDWLPPDQVTQLIQGSTETLGLYKHRMTLACSPGSPWRVAVYGQDRYDTAGSELDDDVDDTSTTLSVATTSGPVWTEDILDLPIALRFGGEVVRVVPADQVTDTFDRTASSGWGTSDSGDAWTATGGSASDFSVSSAAGRVSMGSVNVRRFTSAGSLTDVAIRADITVPALATGNGISAGLIARRADDNNFYLVQLVHDTAGTIDVEINKRVAGVFSTLASVSNLLTYAAGVPTHARFRIQGDVLVARVWSGETEPDGWHLMATDSALTTAGAVGTHTNLITGNTNSTPVITYAAVEALAPGVSGSSSPQTMTVVRSVNGIVKSHSAGTAISLADPVPYAL